MSKQKSTPPGPFKIQQLALCPRNPEAAKALLREMGAGEWAEDLVQASGEVFEQEGRNAAELSFEYELLSDARELEVLSYVRGPNWMDMRADADPAASDWSDHGRLRDRWWSSHDHDHHLRLIIPESGWRRPRSLHVQLAA